MRRTFLQHAQERNRERFLTSTFHASTGVSRKVHQPCGRDGVLFLDCNSIFFLAHNQLTFLRVVGLRCRRPTHAVHFFAAVIFTLL